MRPGRPPSSEDSTDPPPAPAFTGQRADTVKLSVAQLKRQLEAHGLTDITESDVAVSLGDPDAHLRRLVDD